MDQIYLRDLGTGGRWQVSRTGDEAPKWGRDGRRPDYRNRELLLTVEVRAGNSFSVKGKLPAR